MGGAHAGAHHRPGEFVAWNAFGFVLVCVGAALAASQERLRWIEIAMGISVLGNVAVHVATSVLTRTYSPGLISGVVIWIPVALWRIGAAVRLTSRRGRTAGVAVGLAVVLTTLAVLGWTAL